MTRRSELERPSFSDFMDLWNRPFALGRLGRLLEDDIRVEEYRDGDTYVVRADMPGIDPEKDVEITVADGVLQLRAERRVESETQERDYRRSEIRYGSFSRTLPLPPGASEDDVQATYADGVLEVRIPVREQGGAARKVTVQRR